MPHTHPTHALISPLGAAVTAERPPAAPFLAPSADQEIILPKYLYIKDKDGNYLLNRSEPRYGTLTFVKVEPSLDTQFQAIKTSPSWYQFLARNKNYIGRYYSGWYSSDTYSSPSYNVFQSSGNKVYLKDNYDLALFISNELNEWGAPVAHDFINETSEMEIVQAAVKNEILDVEYDIKGAQVRDAPPIIALSISIRNDSDAPVNQVLEYKYEKWSVGTWNNSAGLEIGITASFTAGTPIVADANYDVTITDADAHEWGGERGKKETITTSSTITIPPKQKGRATVYVRNAQIEVNFTYGHRIFWANGEREKTAKTGVYRNVDSWHVDVVLDNWEPVS